MKKLLFLFLLAVSFAAQAMVWEISIAAARVALGVAADSPSARSSPEGEAWTMRVGQAGS